jgi:peptidyl-prolyl cis-trans isomerase D
MMQSMRNLAHTPVVKGLMLILVVSFALWGIGDIFRGNPLERSVAKVGRKSISVQELNSQFDKDLARARQMFGPELSAQQAKQMGILDKTLQTMVQRSAVDQSIKKLGLEVSQKTVLDEVAAQPQFRDKDGKFNAALFRQILQQAHMDEKTMLSEGQKDMERQQLVGAFTTDVKAPQSVIDAIYKARGQKRILDVITLKNSSITDVPAPDDKALQDYYQAHLQAFTAPEYRTITIARLSTDDVAKDITISDDDLKKEYDTQHEQLAQPERRDILQVVMQDEAKAKQLAAAANTSRNLTKSAKDMGYDAIPINQADEKSLPPELAKPAFALEVNQVSDPVHSSLGWHVVQLKKITPAGTPEFADIKDQLREAMQRDQAIENVSKLTNQLDDQLAGGHALEDIADGMKMRLIKIASVDIAGKTPDGKDPAELPNKEVVLKTAFAQGAGDTSPILDDKNGNYSVVRTDSITPSAPKPFDEVKAEVVTAWKAEQQAKAAKDQADKIAQGLRDGKTPESFANGENITVRVTKPVSMLGDTDPELAPSVLPQIYKLKKGDVTTASVGATQVILRLNSLSEADAAGDAAKLKITDELKKNGTTELTQQYLDYLKQIFPVEINQDALESVRQQGS